MYGNYGRQEDLDVLQKKSVELKDSVLLLRSGKISFAEQVGADLMPSHAISWTNFLVCRERSLSLFSFSIVSGG